MTGPEQRREELAAGLAATRERIARACDDAGRDSREVTLVVVTKFFPASDVRLLAELGVADVGENRHPEGRDKAAETADLGLRWHYIGGLQSNKAAAVAAYADVVHSLDRAKLVGGLARGAHERGRPLDVLLQVSLDDAETRGARAGVEPARLGELADRVAEEPDLRLRGLMAVAPVGEEPAQAFGRLADVRAGWLADRPQADWLSAGMSGDLEEAVKAGATHVRVGSAILGPRPSLL